MFTKSNLPAILTLALLFLTIGILFWHGDQTIQKANDVKSTIIAWENLSNSHPLHKGGQNLKNEDFGGFSKNLNFFIQNLEDKTNSYQVTFLVNEEEVDSQKIEIKSKRKEIITPTKKALAKLTELSKTNPSSSQSDILYQVKISWGKNKNPEIIGKWIRH